MLKARICPGCGAPIGAGAPEELCPRCLLGLGLGLDPGQAVREHVEAPSFTPELNTPQFADYELLEEIARGGMGVVYRARQISLNRIVAVKVLLFGRFASAEFVKRFRAEAEAVASLHHPHIVGIYSVGEHQGQHYFAMEFIEGGNLAGLVQQNPLPPRQAARLVETLAEAVAYAHGRGILHRDLKPSNVLIDLEGEPHITDFGLAKRLTGDNPITLTGQIFGSPGYMAPEQAAPGKGSAGPACDIYSLGAILYYLLVGRPPFVAGSVESTIAQVLTGDVLAPRKLNPSLPLDLETICLKCLEREPGRRYATAQELADELARFLNREPIHARPVSWPEKAWRWSVRNPLIAGLGAVVLLLLVVFAGYMLVSSQQIRKEAQRARHAEQDARAELWQAYLAQARAERRSGQAGRRFASLEAIRRATSIRTSAELRDEAIAALALTDVRLTHPWPYNDSRLTLRYNDSLDLFAVQTPNGEVNVCRAADGSSYALLPAVGHTPRWIGGFTPDEKLLAVNYYDDLNYVWNLDTRKPTMEPIPGPSCAIIPGTNQLAVSGADSSFKFYSLPSGKLVRSVPVPETLGAMVVQSGLDIMGAFRHGSPVLYLLEFPSCLERFALTNPANVGSAAFSWDGHLVAVGCYDKRIHVWDTRTGAERAVLEGHENNVIALGFSHNGSLLASASWDNTFRLWDTAAWKQVLEASGLTYELRFAPDDRSLAHLQHGGVAGMLEVSPSTAFRQVHVQPDAHRDGYSIALSPDGCLVATGYSDGAVLRDVATGAELSFLPIGYCRAVMFTPDGTGLLTCGQAGLMLWPIITTLHEGKTQFRLGARRPIREELQFMAATLSADGAWVAAANQSAGDVACYEVAHPEHRFGLTNLPGVQFVSASANFQWLAAGTWGRANVAIWNVPLRRLEHTLPYSSSTTVAFSPDGRLLATDSTLYEVWEAGSWRKLYQIKKPNPEDTCGPLAFSPDSRQLALLKSSRDLVLLDARTGAELATLQAPGEPRLTSFCFSADGSKLVALQSDQSLQIWDLLALRRQLAALNLDW